MAVSIAAVALLAAGLSAPKGALAATPTRVVATITGSRIAFDPNYVPTGPAVITVVNRSGSRREFEAGAQRTGAIAPGHSARLTVTLSGAERQFSSVAAAGSRHLAGGSHRLTAALHLFAPCSDPSATTVDVQIDKSAGGLMLSASTVPCGTVTFDVTDVDAPYAALLVSADAPPRSGMTPELNPGGTATLTVQFPTVALAHCSVVQVGGDGIVTAIGDGSLTVG
jgi:hypothetical protein